jgi:hypothetical protein
MIPSNLRRALLVLAVVAFAISRASAQTDAAFASALRTGAPSPAQFAEIKAKPQKPAPAPQAKAPSAPDAVWAKVIETVKRDGKYKPGNPVTPGSFSIEDTIGDPKGDHSMHGISVLGMLNDEEKFEALGVLIVFMDFKLDPKDGNWHIEQWIFQTDIYGEVGESADGTITKGPDGKILGTTHSARSPSDPKIQAQYDAMLKHWAERQPK